MSDEEPLVESKEPGSKPEAPSKRGITWPRWTGFRNKTIWDWLQLLVVPLMLALITVVFTWQQAARQQRIEDHRAESDRRLEEQRAQQDTLQAYLDQMGALLLDRNLRTSSENSEVRRLARARTLVVLDALGSNRQSRVLRFLDETELVQAGAPDRPPVISLRYANLHDFRLAGKHLLQGTDLTQSNLSGAELSETDLEGTVLSGAHLEKADLGGADLRGAKLSGAYLHDANLRGADLTGADLSDARGHFESGARMNGAELEGANLGGADLTNAEVSREQLDEARSLEGAIMPDGQKYEDWLKSREAGG